MTAKAAMEAVYADDIYPALGLEFCHLGFFRPGADVRFPQAQRIYVDELHGDWRPAPDDHVLDLGGGNGDVALYLVERFGCRVTVLDIVERTIELARDKARAAGVADRVEAICGDAAEVALPAAAFAGVVSVDCVLHFEAKAPLFDRIHGWLRPGARLVFSSFYSTLSLPVVRRWYLELSVAAPTLSPLQGDLAALELAGFEPPRVRDVTRFVLPPSTAALSQPPYYERVREWHRARYGRLATAVGLPLFLRLHRWV